MTASEEPQELRKFPPETGDVFFNYELEECLKRSRDCVVFVCHHLNDSSLKFVAKIGIQREATKLNSEIHCYRDLEGCDGIPKIIFHKRFVGKRWFLSKEEWIEVDWTMIVIEKLCQKFAKTSKPTINYILSLIELVPMAVQQITLLECVHKRGLIHKGIKPDNFVVSEDGSKVYLIDFNKSKRYLLPSGDHIPYDKDDKRPKGLPLFHSLNYHKGIKCSRRDDLESLGFCWIYLLKGKLPWSTISRKGMHWNNYVKKIGEFLEKTSFEELCSGLPGNSGQYFLQYFQNVRSLKFSETPNYQELRQLIANSLSDFNNNNQ